MYITYTDPSLSNILLLFYITSLHHLLRSNTEVYYRPGLVSVIGGFRTARLPGQATCAAEPLRVSVSNNPTIDQNIIPGLPGSGTTSGNCVVWLVFGGEAVTKGEHCAQLVSCPACACLLVRNNLVNKIEFITQKFLISTWACLSQDVLNIARLHCLKSVR